MINTSKHMFLVLSEPKPLAKIIAVGILYFVLALISINFSMRYSISTVWVSNALLLIFILRDSYLLTWPYLLSGFIACWFANYLTTYSIFISTSFALSNSIELLPVILFFHVYKKENNINQINQNFLLLALAIMCGCAFASLLGALALYISQGARFISTSSLWFATDFMSMIALLPIGLSISKKNLSEFFTVKRLAIFFPFLIFVFLVQITSIYYVPSPFVLIAFSLIFSAFFLTFFEMSLLCLCEVVLIMHNHHLVLPIANIDNVFNITYRYLLISTAIIPALLINVLLQQRIKDTEDIEREIDKEKFKLRDRIKYQASHDSLTGIINRSEFENKLRETIYNKHSNFRIHSLLYLDIDRFKIVNDSAGYVAGDNLLTRISYLLQEHLQAGDTLARIGGDEFAMILLNTETAKAQEISDQLIKSVREFRFLWGGKSYQVGLSVGVVTFESGKATIEDTMSQADIACYTAKFRGGNNVAIYTEVGSEAAKHHAEIQIVSGMREALESGRLCLHAHLIQPLKKTNHLFSFYELLVRLIDSNGNLINPSQFIPTAERFNLMVDIDEWVIRQVLIEMGETIAAIPDFIFSINLSANSINAPYFLNFLQTTLRQTPIPTTRIGFELTETAIINYLEKASAFIQTLQNEGCFIALDDFGSGLSSFNYLKHFPVKYVKIDGSFVRMISESSIDRAIVESINSLAHKLNARTIAEYVETKNILHILNEIGVDYAQGHAIGKSIPLKKLIASKKIKT